MVSLSQPSNIGKFLKRLESIATNRVMTFLSLRPRHFLAFYIDILSDHMVKDTKYKMGGLPVLVFKIKSCFRQNQQRNIQLKIYGL